MHPEVLRWERTRACLIERRPEVVPSLGARTGSRVTFSVVQLGGSLCLGRQNRSHHAILPGSTARIESEGFSLFVMSLMLCLR